MPRNVILDTIPMFLGTKKLMESSKFIHLTGLPHFYSGVAKKGVLSYFNNYVITFLLIGLGT